MLLAATALALVWANSPWAWAYYALWHLPVTAGAGDAVLTQDLQHWINDGLMVLFFFVVGLEIKREVLVGELASARRAALPVGGGPRAGCSSRPASIALLNSGGPGAPGWGVPMATDIAFALGILALLGRRVPLALKVFLTALAVIDDIGAVLVIALFYTPSVSWTALAAAAPASPCWSPPTASACARRWSTPSWGSSSGWPSCCPASTPRWPACCWP